LFILQRRELGSDPLVKSKNRIIVTALREIAAGKVTASNQTPLDPNGDDLPPMSN
jgi:DNA-directed RNA polymerase subunit K/omega